jgi:hemerythrin
MDAGMNKDTSKDMNKGIGLVLTGTLYGGRDALVEELEQLPYIPDERFASSFSELIDLVEKGFRNQEETLEALHYPALHICLEQHARALGALHQAAPRVEAGDIPLGRQAAQLLRNWLLPCND